MSVDYSGTCLEPMIEGKNRPSVVLGVVMPCSDNYVAWCRYDNGAINTCNSDDLGAFKVYRGSTITELEQQMLDEQNKYLSAESELHIYRTALEKIAQILPMGNTVRERECWKIVKEVLNA